MQVEPALEMAQAVRLHRERCCELCLVLQSLRCLVHCGPGASGVGLQLEARSKYLLSPPIFFFFLKELLWLFMFCLLMPTRRCWRAEKMAENDGLLHLRGEGRTKHGRGECRVQ